MQENNGYPPRFEGCAGVFLIALIIGTILIAAICLAWPAFAHDAPPTGAQPLGWQYPWACCSGMDCGRADGDVKETPEGYVILHSNETIPYGDKRIKDSPDGEFHWCAHRQGIDANKTICLFVPPRGF